MANGPGSPDNLGVTDSVPFPPVGATADPGFKTDDATYLLWTDAIDYMQSFASLGTYTDSPEQLANLVRTSDRLIQRWDAATSAAERTNIAQAAAIAAVAARDAFPNAPALPATLDSWAKVFSPGGPAATGKAAKLPSFWPTPDEIGSFWPRIAVGAAHGLADAADVVWRNTPVGAAVTGIKDGFAAWFKANSGKVLLAGAAVTAVLVFALAHDDSDDRRR